MVGPRACVAQDDLAALLAHLAVVLVVRLVAVPVFRCRGHTGCQAAPEPQRRVDGWVVGDRWVGGHREPRGGDGGEVDGRCQKEKIRMVEGRWRTDRQEDERTAGRAMMGGKEGGKRGQMTARG